MCTPAPLPHAQVCSQAKPLTPSPLAWWWQDCRRHARVEGRRQLFVGRRHVVGVMVHHGRMGDGVGHLAWGWSWVGSCRGHGTHLLQELPAEPGDSTGLLGALELKKTRKEFPQQPRSRLAALVVACFDGCTSVHGPNKLFELLRLQQLTGGRHEWKFPESARAAVSIPQSSSPLILLRAASPYPLFIACCLFSFFSAKTCFGLTTTCPAA